MNATPPPIAPGKDDDSVLVLVADDDAELRMLIAAMLEDDGYRVATAADGAEALRMVETLRPHCLILDIDMPGMDGNELSRRMRERFVDDVVLVAMTGSDPQRGAVAQTFDRVDHYLTKPVLPEQLRKLLPPLHGR